MATWTVQPGDTLTGLARTLLGSSVRWRELQLYNWRLLTNPDVLAPGMVLRLPPGAKLPRLSAGAGRSSRRTPKGLRAAARSGR